MGSGRTCHKTRSPGVTLRRCAAVQYLLLHWPWRAIILDYTGVANAQYVLNPHQVDCKTFIFQGLACLGSHPYYRHTRLTVSLMLSNQVMGAPATMCFHLMGATALRFKGTWILDAHAKKHGLRPVPLRRRSAVQCRTPVEHTCLYVNHKL